MGCPGLDGIGGAPKAGEGFRGGGPGVEPLTAGGLLGSGATETGFR